MAANIILPELQNFMFFVSKNSDFEDELKKRTQEAYEKGVFGAPTFVVNNKIFWGQDRLEYALAESLK